MKHVKAMTVCKAQEDTDTGAILQAVFAFVLQILQLKGTNES